MVRFDKSKLINFKKLMLIKEYFNKFNIYYKIILFHNIIEQENIKFEYVYENIKYINIDDYLIKIIKDLNFDLITIMLNNKSMLEYNSNILDKFIYIISSAANLSLDIEMLQIIINKYIPKIINHGKTYDFINACLLCFITKTNNQNIIINFDYKEGLIKCLHLSPRWDELILYFHNKQLINKFYLGDIVCEVSKSYKLILENF